MSIFFYIQITDSPEAIKFSNPLFTYIKTHHPATLIYDFDNYSDALILWNASKLLTESEETLIFIDSKENSNFSKIIPFLTNLLDSPAGVKLILKGNNIRLEKMISILPHLKIPKNTYEIEQIVQFFGKIF